MNSDVTTGTVVYCADGQAGTVQAAECDPESGALIALTITGLDLGEVRVPAVMLDGSPEGEVRLRCTLDDLRHASEATRALHDYYVPESGERRPLWYRAAASLETLRPVFTWIVENEDTVKVVGLAFFLGFGSLVSYAAGQRVGALLRRRG